MDGVIPTPNRAKEFEFVVHLSTGVAGAMQRQRHTELVGIIIILCHTQTSSGSKQKVGRISNFRQENYGAAFFGKRHDAAAALRRVTRYGCFALQRRKAHSVFYYRQSQKISPLLLLVWSKARLCLQPRVQHNSSHAAQAVRSNHDTHFA